VHRGFSKAACHLYKPDLGVCVIEKPKPDGVCGNYFGSLVDIKKERPDTDKYVLTVHHVKLGGSDGPSENDLTIQPVIEEKLEQIVEALK
jgi:hypothetical protein